jgi:hypothetical protein
MKTQNINANQVINRLKITSLFLALSLLFTIACSKDSTAEPDEIAEPEVEIESITLNKTELELKKGESEQLSVTSDVKGQNIEWSINEASVASIASDGSLTALGNGKAIITAKAGSQSTTCVLLVSVDIYVAGYEDKNTVPVAKYWKNGDEVALTDGALGAKLYTIAVDQNNVYTAGYESNGQHVVAKNWINSSPTALDSGETGSIAIAGLLDGNDVYRTGNKISGGTNISTYWKNGAEVALADGSRKSSSAGIYVTTENVFVSGAENNGSVNVAKYWRHERSSGNIFENVLSSPATEAYAFGIAVDGEDIYAVGYLENAGGSKEARYWKNKEEFSLDTAEEGSEAYAVMVHNGDLFIAGYVTTGGTKIATYWKNGTPVGLSDGTKNAVANQFVISDGDVYVAGWERIGPTYAATYWVNGNPVYLTDGTKDAEALSITVF